MRAPLNLEISFRLDDQFDERVAFRLAVWKKATMVAIEYHFRTHAIHFHFPENNNMTSNEGRRFPVEVLTQDEIRRLIGACSKRSATGARNRALLVLLYRTGLRISEALGLHLKDLDAKAGTVRALRGKGGKPRTVGMDAAAFDILQLWLEKRVALRLGGRQPVFCTLLGDQLSTAYVRAMVRRLGRKAAIEKRAHCHALRHSHAYELANENVPLHVISAQLGHASVSTTHRYVAHLHPAAVIQTIRAREWIL